MTIKPVETDPADKRSGSTTVPANGPASLRSDSAVLAVVTHYRCEKWLENCLTALVTQTRPPQNIVVVDDASSPPPVDIVKRCSQVTLLSAVENVGSYRLLQQIVDD